MTHSNPPGDGNSGVEGISNQTLLLLIFELLTGRSMPEKASLDTAVIDDELFDRVYSQISDLRELSFALSNGDLKKNVSGRGHILSNLKALQSNLRHLTWQTTQIAEGDFTQSVDFLGEFSDSFNEMTEKLRQSTEDLQTLASTDPLTKISNRLALNRYLALAFDRARTAGSGLCVLLFDLDHFKRINDTYGHDIGDKVLVQASAAIGKQFRAADLFARYGGEEFMAVLPGTKLDAAVKIAQRCIARVEQCVIDADGHELAITASAGVSEILPEDTSHEDIVKRSDDALYAAKHDGRNCVRTA